MSSKLKVKVVAAGLCSPVTADDITEIPIILKACTPRHRPTTGTALTAGVLKSGKNLVFIWTRREVLAVLTDIRPLPAQ